MEIVWVAGQRNEGEFMRVVKAFAFHYARVVMGPNFRMGVA